MECKLECNEDEKLAVVIATQSKVPSTKTIETAKRTYFEITIVQRAAVCVCICSESDDLFRVEKSPST